MRQINPGSRIPTFLIGNWKTIQNSALKKKKKKKSKFWQCGHFRGVTWQRRSLEKRLFLSPPRRHFTWVHPTALLPSSHPWLSTVRFMQPALQCFAVKHIVMFFQFKQKHQKNSRLKIWWKLFIKKLKYIHCFFLGCKCHWRKVVLDLQATFKCLQIQCYKNSAAQAQLERARHRRQTRSLWQRGTCLICWAAQGWKKQTTRAWRIWSVAQSWVKVSPCGGTWQLQSPSYFMSALISTPGLAILL